MRRKVVAVFVFAHTTAAENKTNIYFIAAFILFYCSGNHILMSFSI